MERKPNPDPATPPGGEATGGSAGEGAAGESGSEGGARPDIRENKRNVFQFKQFAVTQERAAMRVGTDGVLLGAWASLPAVVGTAPQRILDIGTGTGVIALILAQRTAARAAGEAPMPVIDTVEVDPDTTAEAQVNFDSSPWKGIFKTHAMPVQRYAASAPKPYDLIVSNPPYFMAGTDFRRGFDTSAAATEPSAARVAARHAEALPYDELIDAVLQLLEPKGRFAAIFPYRESGIFIAKAAARGLYMLRVLEVRGAPHKPVKRVAAEFSFIRKAKSEVVRETLCIDDGAGGFTEAYRTLTRDFYLRF